MNKKIQLIKNPSDIAAGTRGASMGIAALEVSAQNVGSNFFDVHPSVEVRNQNKAFYDKLETPNAKCITAVCKVYEDLSESVKMTLNDQKMPVVLSGDHASAGGTIAGIKAAFPEKRLGVIWIDAHADIHSPYTTPSGNIHGMPLATALGIDNEKYAVNSLSVIEENTWNSMKQLHGICPKILPEDLVYFGVRDTEQQEDQIIADHQIKNITVAQLREKGAREQTLAVLERLNSCDILYVSFDVDSMDPDEISYGTGTPVKEGFTSQEIHQILDVIAESDKLACLEMVEINPTLDNKCNKMADTAFEILKEFVNKIDKK